MIYNHPCTINYMVNEVINSCFLMVYRFLLITCVMVGFSTNAFADESDSVTYDYPKTRSEREMDKMGSVINSDGKGQGIVLTPKHVRSEETKATVSIQSGESNKDDIAIPVNKFLWEASIEELRFMPIESMDISHGTIVTDWYSTQDKSDYAFKVLARVKGDVIAADMLDVTVYERKFIDGKWYNQEPSESLTATFEDKILQKAKKMYHDSK